MLTLNFRNGIVTVSVSVICAYRGEKELCEGIFPDGYLQIKCFPGFPPRREGKGDNEDGDRTSVVICRLSQHHPNAVRPREIPTLPAQNDCPKEEMKHRISETPVVTP